MAVKNTEPVVVKGRRMCFAAALILMAITSPASAFTPSSSMWTPTLVRPQSTNRSAGSVAKGSGGDVLSGGLGRSSDRRVPLKRTTSMEMSASPLGAGVAAVAGALSGGVFAGGLHAIAGPDHLAALLPRCCGQRWYRAGRIGALWGMGHGMSATLLGVLAYGLKSRVSNMQGMKWLLSGASSAMEIAVGASLVVIGLLGIREAREWEAEIQEVTPQSLSAAAADPGIKTAQKRAVVFNGLLHGFSWDGAPSLAPALAVASWRGNITFLLAYAMGTMGAMAITTTLIGEGTRKAGELMHRPDIPQKLSFASSIVAIGVGAIWCGLALA